MTTANSPLQDKTPPSILHHVIQLALLRALQYSIAVMTPTSISSQSQHKPPLIDATIISEINVIRTTYRTSHSPLNMLLFNGIKVHRLANCVYDKITFATHVIFDYHHKKLHPSLHHFSLFVNYFKPSNRLSDCGN